MQSSKRTICQAVVSAVSLMAAASAAMAQVSILGGGSTLIQPALTSEVTLFGKSNAGTVSYFGVGSDLGGTAFLNNDPSVFGPGVTGTVSYGNSDSPLTSAQVSTAASYALTSADGKLIQLPYAVTPITIPVVNPPAGVSSPVVLNDADLCGIFSGRITDWAGTGTPRANFVANPATGAAYTTTPAPIHVVYRSDGSGTSDLLTRHLQAVCSSANSNVTFKESQTFAANFTTVPSTFTWEQGSGSVANELTTLRTAGTSAFGYLSPDYTNTTLAPSSAPAITNNLAVASLVNASGATVAPTYLAATAALAVGVTIPSGAAEANPFNWVPGAITPTPTNPAPAVWTAIANPTDAAAYPISGTTNIILSQCYRVVGRAALIHDFLNMHYNDPTFIAVLHNIGFDVPSAYVGTINNDILASSSLQLNVQNSSVCTTGFGR